MYVRTSNWRFIVGTSRIRHTLYNWKIRSILKKIKFAGNCQLGESYFHSPLVVSTYYLAHWSIIIRKIKFLKSISRDLRIGCRKKMRRRNSATTGSFPVSDTIRSAGLRPYIYIQESASNTRTRFKHKTVLFFTFFLKNKKTKHQDWGFNHNLSRLYPDWSFVRCPFKKWHSRYNFQFTK